MNEAEKISWIRLARTEGIGPITFRKLIQKYKSADVAIESLPHITRKKPIVVYAADAAKRELESTHKLKGKMLTLLDDEYPQWLKNIEDAPPILSVIGQTDIFKRPCVGIVGSRNSSLNARKFSHALAHDLGAANFVIASGLARGIDTAAHEGSLNTGTIAVIAGGVDVVYPKENEKLYREIAEHGAIVSEAPLTMQPLATHFPKRNRIITGLSQGVVVVEANERSGSLISARTAGEQGRAVMAVPGFPSDPRSCGTNDLIRNGAVLVCGANDVIEELSNFTHEFQQTTNYGNLCEADDSDISFDAPLPAGVDLAETEAILLSNISISPCSIDEIVRACHLNIVDVQVILFELELSGVVQRLPGNRICRIA